MILFCGSVQPTLDYLREVEDEVASTEDKLTDVTGVEWIVAHGYRHIVSEDVLGLVPAVNIHPSYLPFNRGAHPYLWSVVEGTPSGVTVHLMDAHLDTGPIFAQRRVVPNPDETIWEHRSRLEREGTALFREVWPDIRSGNLPPEPQRGAGSYHRLADRERVDHLLDAGFDTSIAALREAA